MTLSVSKVTQKLFNDYDPVRQTVDCSALCILRDLPTAFYPHPSVWHLFSDDCSMDDGKKDYMNCCLPYCIYSYEHFLQINYLVKFI